MRSGPSSRVKAIATSPGNEPFRSEALQLVAGQKRHRQAEKKRDHRDQRDGTDAGPFGVAKETRRAKRHPAAAHPIERFADRIDDEPEDAPDFLEQRAALFADVGHEIGRGMDERFGGPWRGGRVRDHKR